METTPDPAEHAQFLTFGVAGEEYAIPVLQVREILPYTGATKVPMAPAEIRGVINLRGSAVPVIDLAVRFGLAETPVSKRTCVVILDGEPRDDAAGIGILTEEVHVVVALGADDIEPAPSLGTRVRTDHLHGMGKVEDRFVPILDVGRLLAADAATYRLASETARPESERPDTAPEDDPEEARQPGSGAA